MALAILNDTVQIGNDGLPTQLLPGSNATIGTQAPTTAFATHNISSNGVGSIILVPNLTVSADFNKVGIGGWMADYKYVYGDYLDITVAVGSFAYANEFNTLTSAFNSDRSKVQVSSSVSSLLDSAATSVNNLYKAPDGGSAEGSIVANQLQNDAAELKSLGYSQLAQDTQALEGLANKWSTPKVVLGTDLDVISTSALDFEEYYPASQSSLGFGVNLVTVNGAESTWEVPPNSNIALKVGGYSAEQTTNGNAGLIVNIGALTSEGQIDIASTASAVQQTINAPYNTPGSDYPSAVISSEAGGAGGGSPGGPKTISSLDSTSQEVERLYYSLLLRAADPAGLAADDQFLANHPAQIRKVANGMIQSQEYHSLHGHQSNSAFVEALYEAALGRSADSHSLMIDTRALTHGMTRQALAVNIAESAEAIAHLGSKPS